MKNCSAAELNTCQVTINLIFLREKLLKKYEREKKGEKWICRNRGEKYNKTIVYICEIGYKGGRNFGNRWRFRAGERPKSECKMSSIYLVRLGL